MITLFASPQKNKDINLHYPPIRERKIPSDYEFMIFERNSPRLQFAVRGNFVLSPLNFYCLKHILSFSIIYGNYVHFSRSLVRLKMQSDNYVVCCIKNSVTNVQRWVKGESEREFRVHCELLKGENDSERKVFLRAARAIFSSAL
jgi:hypothetical protein